MRQFFFVKPGASASLSHRDFGFAQSAGSFSPDS